MTSHRTATDSEFQSTIDALQHSSISTKLAQIEIINGQLNAEQGTVESERSQLHKHKQKVRKALENQTKTKKT